MKHKKIKQKKVKAWAVCFAINKRCLQGKFPTFPTRAEAKTYITELHKRIGGFEDDHHIILITITYKI